MATEGNDTLPGTAGDDTIEGLGGDDLLEGLSGLDTLDGGDGHDTLDGGDDDDLMLGGGGDDSLDGGFGNDTIYGNAGNDTLNGSFGDDTMFGGEGDDVYFVVTNGDSAREEDLDGGIDTVFTQRSIDLGDTNYIENLSWVAVGGGGFCRANGLDNILTGIIQNVEMNGEGGVDTISYAPLDVAVTIDLLNERATSDSIFGEDTLLGLENAIGGSANDTLVGDGVNNVLDGNTGADSMAGGYGNDTYIVDDANDAVSEADNDTLEGALVLPGPGSGLAGIDGITDTVLASVNYSLANAQFVENMTLTGSASRATGNSLANVLTGNAGSDTLNGGAGNDTLNGGSGSDRLIGGGGSDRLVWGDTDRIDGGAGTDTLKVGISLNLKKVANTDILGIEQVDMRGGGSRTFTVTQTDVLALSSTTDTVKIFGDAGDRVSAAGFVQVTDTGTFYKYKSGMAILLVESDVNVVT